MLPPPGEREIGQRKLVPGPGCRAASCRSEQASARWCQPDRIGARALTPVQSCRVLRLTECRRILDIAVVRLRTASLMRTHFERRQGGAGVLCRENLVGLVLSICKDRRNSRSSLIGLRRPGLKPRRVTMNSCSNTTGLRRNCPPFGGFDKCGCGCESECPAIWG